MIFIARFESRFRDIAGILQVSLCTLQRLTHTTHELAPNFANVFEYIISDCVQISTILRGFIDRAGLLVIVCARHGCFVEHDTNLTFAFSTQRSISNQSLRMSLDTLVLLAF